MTEFTVDVAHTIMTTLAGAEAGNVDIETAKDALKCDLQLCFIYGLFADCLNGVRTSIKTTLLQPLEMKLASFHRLDSATQAARE